MQKLSGWKGVKVEVLCKCGVGEGRFQGSDTMAEGMEIAGSCQGDEIYTCCCPFRQFPPGNRNWKSSIPISGLRFKAQIG